MTLGEDEFVNFIGGIVVYILIFFPKMHSLIFGYLTTNLSYRYLYIVFLIVPMSSTDVVVILISDPNIL